MKLLEELHDLMRRLRVEIARRLVRHDDVRIVDEGSRDGDALALPARKLVGLVVGAIGKADGLQKAHGALAPLASSDARIDERQGDVFSCAALREQVEVLKYEADFLVAREGERIVGEVRDLFASVRLYVGKSDGRVRRVELEEKSGDRTTITLKNVQANVAVDDALFNR